ncbi:hypothetical protein [Leptospira mtsangambouensis]|uniref:hypothetical protein n=1 Tax=Leptospira mtsangambouensis TaxID=2484912 RepID=UPI001EEC55D4|nr:hypothetical protein [Leptospira mtsangambouensis]MCG6142770.1 hypothetical protein [Leptospira mtsangambouensis]
MNNLNLEVIDIASKIYQKFWNESIDVSNQTRKAQRITKEWQDSLSKFGYKSEVRISKENFEKIDLINPNGKVAYEMKVSGKNISHEIFKDIYKIITHNLHNVETQISDLVFISEPKSIYKMNKRLDQKYLKYLSDFQNLKIHLLPIIPENAISSLMTFSTDKWGLRGDPYLWFDLIRNLSLISIPNSKEILKTTIIENINELINDRIEIGKNVYVEKYDYEGMSSGVVSGEFWMLELIPNILSKFDEL